MEIDGAVVGTRAVSGASRLPAIVEEREAVVVVVDGERR
ncbi:hypothetical protein A2U01_0030523 [Trifolium medium]|uniref:Uncharacterized protein n=1 Tax=Trifolium medium TaxID=97028 RepID=A0A392PCT8_9FABA|nr:hypothetical protein [Trifolium medium]